MATRMFEVQQKMFSALTNNPDLTSKITGIFDYVPEKTPTPYITFGHIISNSDYTKTDNGERITFTLDIWSMAKGRKEAVTILTLVEQILEPNLVLDTALIIEQRVVTRDVIEESYGLYHASIMIDYQIEWEA